MQTGWKFINGKWYYLTSSGSMHTDWLHDGDSYYYLSSDMGGAMLTGVHIIDGYRREFSSSGAVNKYGYQNTQQLYQVSSWDVPPFRADAGIFSYVSPCMISVDATRNQVVEAFIRRAYGYLGTPYVWDYACAPGIGVDCAGLVNQCLYAVGMDTIYNSYLHWTDPWQDHNAENMRADSRFKKINIEERQRGDLLFYRGHVGIYLGNNQIINAVSPREGVRIVAVDRWPITGVSRPFS